MTGRINKLLKDKLGNKNLSEVAKEVGISRSVLHDWVHGDRLPSLKNIKHLESLTDYLGISIQKLLTGDETGKTISTVTFRDDGKRYRINIERLE